MTQQETDIIKAFDDASTAVGNEIAKLIAAQPSGALDADFVAALNGEVSKLTALGAGGVVPPPVPAA